MKKHRRQFIIGNKPIDFVADTVHKLMTNGLYISYDAALPVWIFNGNLLIGNAICTKSGKRDYDLISSDDFDFVRDSESWVGRWLFIENDCLFSDVTTSLAVFYLNKNHDFWLSSSVSLLSLVDKTLEKKPLVYREKNHLAPTTCIDGVSQLIIGESVNLKSGDCRWQGFLPVKKLKLSEDELLESIVQRLSTAAATISTSGKKIYSALTSGRDSRLDLSAFVSSGITDDFATYTFIKNKILMNGGDRTLPVEMADSMSFKHHQISVDSIDKNAREKFISHAWTVRSEEPGSPLYFFEYGLWQQLPIGCVNIDHCYEIGRDFLFDCGASGINDDLSREDLLNDNYVINDSDYNKLNSYFETITSETNIDRRNLLYLYKSYPFFGRLYQAQDLWVDSTFIGNSREMFSMLLSVESEKRISGEFHEKVVKKLSKELSTFPYNPVEPLWQKILLRIVGKVSR